MEDPDSSGSLPCRSGFTPRPEIMTLNQRAGGTSSLHLDFQATAHIMCIMKNMTLRVEEPVLRQARKIAAERSTSVNALVRQYLKNLVSKDNSRKQARQDFLLLCEESQSRITSKTWTREDLYDR